jgi:hypothetical protein
MPGGLPDVLGELVIGELACRRDGGAVGVVGGTGDLQQLVRPFDVALLCLLRLDEQKTFTGSPSRRP